MGASRRVLTKWEQLPSSWGPMPTQSSSWTNFSTVGSMTPWLTRETNSSSMPMGVSPPGKLTRLWGSFSTQAWTRSAAQRLMA